MDCKDAIQKEKNSLVPGADLNFIRSFMILGKSANFMLLGDFIFLY